jgi:hypothetical protein
LQIHDVVENRTKRAQEIRHWLLGVLDKVQTGASTRKYWNKKARFCPLGGVVNPCHGEAKAVAICAMRTCRADKSTAFILSRHFRGALQVSIFFLGSASSTKAIQFHICGDFSIER